MNSKEFLDILHVAERLKDTPRHCTTSKGRVESVAEHSWRVSLMALLFDEMNEQKTIESKLYKSLDKLEALIQHNESPISTWSENEFELNKKYAFDTYDMDQIFIFSHTLEDNIGGQLKAGFTLVDLFEDRDTEETEGLLIKNYFPQYVNTLSKKCFW